MRIEKLLDDVQARGAWDQLVSESNNGTVFHSLRFLAYHPDDRFNSHHLVAYKRNKLVAVMPGALYDDRRGSVIVSHPGASFGGWALPHHFSFDDAMALTNVLLEHMAKSEIRNIELTLPPSPYLEVPHQTMEYALISAGFGYRKREYTSMVSLDTPPDEVLRKFPKKTRADVRQAEKLDIRITWHEDPSVENLNLLYHMLLDNRRDLGLDTPPAHSLEELVRIKKLMPGMLVMGMAHSGDTPVATTLVFRCNARVLLTFYICHDRTARDRHPVHLMLYDLICEGTRQGYKYVDFGISTVDMNPLFSLIRFKESFMAQGFFRETFEKSL